uniref:Nuclear pore complex protein Nup153 n=1 Tax=Anopheles albimanus TaxID=7167 RepID=A0A182FMK1_ANOAL
MERSESGDDQANEEDCGVMAPDATAQDTCTADDAKMQEECAGVDAVGIGSVQPQKDSDSSQANPVEPDSWEIFEISDDEEVSKPATLDGHSFDLTGDCSDEDAKTTIVNKSAGDLLSSAPSKQVAAPNEDMESINELPTEAYSADAAKSQLPYQTIEPGVDYRNASQPVRDVHVPSGDGAAKVVAEQQRHSTRLPSHHVAPFIQEAGGGGSSTSSSSTAVSLYHSRPVGNASGNGRIQCRQSGLPNIRLNETHFLDKLLAAVQQTYAPDETHSPPRQPINQSFKSTRSWNPPYTVPKRPRVPMEELVIPTITQLLKYKRQLQTKDNLHGSEEDRDADTESDDTTSDFEQGGIIHSPSPAYIASTAGKSDKKQTTKIKPTITRTRPSAASSSNDLFAPALRHELPNVALQGLTSLPKLDVSPEFCFGPGSSQPAWKMMTSVSNSVDKQHQPLSVAAEPSSVPFQFIHPEILGSWLENTNLSSSGPSIVFDFAAPISLETDVVSGSAVPIQSDSARPAKLVPFAQLPKTGARKWECPTCMLFNELSITRCIACECPQPTTKETAGTTSMKPNQSSTTDSTADFKSIVSTRVDGDWECQDCFVRNAANRARCICCGGTPKVFPSSTAGSLAATEQNKPAANIIPAASGDFQLLTQQQKIGKWECSMCLTRNNEVTLRCVCCEQPKPPSTAKQPLVTSNETPATLSSDGVWRMLETTTPVNEKNPIVNKFAFIAPTNATFGNADKFAVDNLTTNQQNFGDIGTIQTFETVSHSSATPLAVAGVTIASVFKFGDPSSQNHSVRQSQQAHQPNQIRQKRGLNIGAIRKITTVKQVNFAEGDRGAAT